MDSAHNNGSRDVPALPWSKAYRIPGLTLFATGSERVCPRSWTDKAKTSGPTPPPIWVADYLERPWSKNVNLQPGGPAGWWGLLFCPTSEDRCPRSQTDKKTKAPEPPKPNKADSSEHVWFGMYVDASHRDSVDAFAFTHSDPDEIARLRDAPTALGQEIRDMEARLSGWSAGPFAILDRPLVWAPRSREKPHEPGGCEGTHKIDARDPVPSAASAQWDADTSGWGGPREKPRAQTMRVDPAKVQIWINGVQLAGPVHDDRYYTPARPIKLVRAPGIVRSGIYTMPYRGRAGQWREEWAAVVRWSAMLAGMRDDQAQLDVEALTPHMQGKAYGMAAALRRIAQVMRAGRLAETLENAPSDAAPTPAPTASPELPRSPVGSLERDAPEPVRICGGELVRRTWTGGEWTECLSCSSLYRGAQVGPCSRIVR